MTSIMNHLYVRIMGFANMLELSFAREKVKILKDMAIQSSF